MQLLVRSMIIGTVLLASQAMAQMETPKCASVSDANLPADLSAWGRAPAALTAAAAPSAALPTLRPGVRTTVTLHPAATVRLVLPPEQARKPEAPHAGLVRVSVPTAGTWRVSASKAVWIDVLAGEATVKSTAFGALAPCTSIRKVVEFPLQPGDHVIQLSGNPGATLDLMISPKP